MRRLWTKRQILVDFAESEPAAKDALLTELEHDIGVTRWILIIGFSLGILTLLYMWGFHLINDGFTAFFWALACFAGGALGGFLFGIPRVLQKDPRPETRLAFQHLGHLPVHSDVTNSPGYRLLVNTNLDDISDWLTKIAVGVGLVELEKLPHLLFSLATTIAAHMAVGTDAPPVSFVMALILYFTIAGFLSGYLTTRMFFQRAFRIADLRAGCDDPEPSPNAMSAKA